MTSSTPRSRGTGSTPTRGCASPGRRSPRAAALFWNVGTHPGADLQRELDRAYAGLFGPVEVAERPWSRTYDADTWTTLLRTHSDHRLLEPDQLEQLLERVAGVIKRFGGTITSKYRTVALLARRLS